MTRQLTLSDWQEFGELYEKQLSIPAPTPTQAYVIGEFVEGKLVGYVVVRYMPVVELWVDEGHRAGLHVLNKLIAKMRVVIKAAQYLGFTKSPKLRRMYELAGLENEGTIFSLRGDDLDARTARRHNSTDNSIVADRV